MCQLFLDDTIINQYNEKMQELEDNGLGKRRRVNPWINSNTNQMFKTVPMTETNCIVSQSEHDEIGNYFDEYLLPAYDLTSEEAESLREQYIHTFKSMMGDMSFTQWLESVTPVIKPWYARGVKLMPHSNDKELL